MTNEKFHDKRTWIIILLIAVIILLAAILVSIQLTGHTGGDKNKMVNQSDRTPIPTLQPLNSNQGEIMNYSWTPGLKVNNESRFIEKEGDRFIIGNVTNNGQESYSQLYLIIELYDKNGERLRGIKIFAPNVTLKSGDIYDLDVPVFEASATRFNITSVVGANPA